MAGTLTDEIMRATGGPTVDDGLRRYYANALPPGPNLIVNATFDADMTGWTIQSGTATWQAGRIRPTRSGGSLGRVRATLSGLQTGSLYRLKYDRFPGVPGSGTVTVSNSATSASVGNAYQNTGGAGSVVAFFTPTLATHWLMMDSGAGINGDYCEYDNVFVESVGDKKTTQRGLERSWLALQTGSPDTYTTDDMWKAMPGVGTIADKKMLYWSAAPSFAGYSDPAWG